MNRQTTLFPYVWTKLKNIWTHIQILLFCVKMPNICTSQTQALSKLIIYTSLPVAKGDQLVPIATDQQIQKGTSHNCGILESSWPCNQLAYSKSHDTLCNKNCMIKVFRVQMSYQCIEFVCSLVLQYSHTLLQTSSVEIQKGTITIQKCFIENQNGAITIQSLCWPVSILLVLNRTSLSFGTQLDDMSKKLTILKSAKFLYFTMAGVV